MKNKVSICLLFVFASYFPIYAQNTALSFEKFLALFPTEKKPLPFAVGKVWLLKQTKQAVLDNATIKKYIILNIKIWSNNLQKIPMPLSPTFYPVAQINLHPNFYSLLLSTSQDENGEVYLLTYNKEGKLIDGVCVIIVRPVSEGYSRSSIFAGGMVLMVKETKQGKANLFTFDINDIGNLHGKL
jgi:hypothetical protein